MNTDCRMPTILVAGSAILWGMYGPFITLLTRMGMARNVQNLIRFLMTALPVLLFILKKDRGMLRVRRKDLPWFFANGFASIFFFSMCYLRAIQETKIATAAALLYTAPVIVMLLSALFFHEKITGRKVFCIFLSVAGCALVSGILGGSLRITPKGLLLGLGAGLGYALYSIFSRVILNRGYTVYTNILYTFVLVTIAYFVLCIADDQVSQIITMPGATAVALLCGILTGAGAYLLYTLGLTGMESSRAAQLATIEPVAAAIFGVIFFEQVLSPVEIAGILLVVGSVILMNRGSA